MRGRKKTYLIELQGTQVEQLRRLVVSRTSPQSEVLRARVVLTCWECLNEVQELIGLMNK